jgi:transcriptional regulator with XRE-family HTH domain
MGTSERAVHRGLRIGREAARSIGIQVRVARIAAGLSQRELGRMVRRSHTAIGRIERGTTPTIDLRLIAIIGAVLGLDLAVRLYPAGGPVRDRAHLGLLERLRKRLSAALRWRTEQPVPIAGDLRAADATVIGQTFDAMVEAETRLSDLQALERRVRTKARDLGVMRVILLVADTRTNRAILAAHPEFTAAYPISTRACLRALSRGEDPGGDAIVIL